MKKVICVLAVLAVGVAILGCGEEEEKTPFTPRPFEVWVTQEHVRQGQWPTYVLAKYKPNGSLLSSVKIESFVGDITYLNGKVYGIANRDDSAILLEIDPNNGSVINYRSLYNSFRGYAGGIASDDKYLRISSRDREKIYTMTTTGSIISSVPALNEHARGLDCYGSYLWYFDRENKNIIKAKASDGDIVYQTLYIKGLFGLGYDGQYLWGFPYEPDDVVSRVNPKTGETIQEFNIQGENARVEGLTVYFKD